MYINRLIKKQLLLSIATFLIIGLIIGGSSYALFETTTENTDDQTIAVGNLNVTYANGSIISIESIEPTSDTAAQAKTDNIYNFTINNTGSTSYSYTIKIIDNSNYLAGGSLYDSSRKLLSHSYIRYNLDGGANFTLGDKEGGLIYSGVIPSGTSRTFNLRLWIADAEEYNIPNEALGSEVHLSILIDGKSSKDKNAADTIKELIVSPTENGGVEAVDETLTSQLHATRNYYFYGSNPNNYVTFNNESWRIIGVFETENEHGLLKYMVKLIRSETIGAYSWNTSASTVNSGNGTNNWSDAALMKLLNPDYQTESINNSLYWNKSSGTCFNGANNANTTCDFTSTGLLTTSQAMIQKVKYYLGGGNSLSITPNVMYSLEKGETVITNPSDNTARGVSWIGYVGLMYPSDYAFGVSDSVCARTTPIEAYGTTSACHVSNWLWTSNSEHTLTPSSNNASTNYAINSSGEVGTVSASSNVNVRPVVYLKTSIKIKSGEGTITSPYILE